MRRPYTRVLSACIRVHLRLLFGPAARIGILLPAIPGIRLRATPNRLPRIRPTRNPALRFAQPPPLPYKIFPSAFICVHPRFLFRGRVARACGATRAVRR